MKVLKCFKYDWNHFEKDNTLMCNVQSKSVNKGYINYNKNITVNDVESLCAVFCACVERVHNGATPPWQLSSLVHLAAFCLIVRSNIVFICYVYLL